MTAPRARAVLEDAHRTNAAAGHENLGFLSIEHGFLPARPPLRSLSGAGQPWDEAAQRLPEMYRDLEVRPGLEALPSVSVDAIPEVELLRAAALLGIFAHAWVHAPGDEDAALPEVIAAPWAAVSARLGRREPLLTYVDLIAYNWRLRDARGPRLLDNLELLVPTVGNDAERIFYLSQVDMMHRSRALIGLAIELQEACAHRSAEAIEAVLVDIRALIDALFIEGFMKVDPNERAPTHVDPVRWAKTVAPLAVPIRAGQPAPGGASSPIFHLLDALFGRGRYDSHVGHESRVNNSIAPPHWSRFIDAVAAFSTADGIRRMGQTQLSDLFHDSREAYAGARGFLGKHRLKAYGYLETAFKLGRLSTNSGMVGDYLDRGWEAVDLELEKARRERYPAHRPPVALQPERAQAFEDSVQRSIEARVIDAARARSEGGEVVTITFGFEERALNARPGDQLGILPESSSPLVERTLAALRARGDELIHLDRPWQMSLQHRLGVDAKSEALPLADFLKFGRIRPVSREMAKRLGKFVVSERLDQILEARREDQWELWDLVELLAETGWDPSALWRARPGETEYLGHVVRPLPFRHYSIAGIEEDEDGRPRTVRMLVSQLRYESDGRTKGVARAGTASSFLAERATDHLEGRPPRPVSIQVFRANAFAMPSDNEAPIIMFAAGTGVAPFLAFIERTRAPARLLLGLRGPDDFDIYRGAIERALDDNPQLSVLVSFSAAAIELRTRDGRLERVEAEPRYITTRALMPDVRPALEARARDGRAVFYVCGRAGFAHSVQSIMHTIAGGKAAFEDLVANRRFRHDVFTTYAPHHLTRKLDASEVAMKNDPTGERWMIISGRVYDLTEFATLHPGGAQLIAAHAGTDATRAYRRVLHHTSPEIDSLLAMYELGSIRRLRFGSAWGLTLDASGMITISLSDTFSAWARALFTVVEMENTLHADLSLAHKRTTSADESGPVRLKDWHRQQAHRRFIEQFLCGAVRGLAETLWRVTFGQVSATAPAPFMGERLESILSRPEVVEEIRRVRGGPGALAAPEILATWEEADRRFLGDLKRSVAEGVRLFESHESRVITKAGADLLERLQDIPSRVDDYVRALC